jgi:farnesyl diphosphate synthase
MILSLDDFQINCQKRTERVFDIYLKKSTAAPKLQEAMRYSVLNGGKRLRSLLVYTSGFAAGATLEDLDAPSAAIELIHSYSLIHDDLPAMDNADLRRGKPSCHKVYGEAIAILAGDALQTLAFEILANNSTAQSNQRLQMIKILTEASGTQGMAAGQTLDIFGVTDLATLTQMYALKTGALLSASIKLGIAAANTQDQKLIDHLEQYAKHLGLAYQIQDDLLDDEGCSDVTGKPQGIDHINQKITYLSLVGKEKAMQVINELFSNAIFAAISLGERGEYLVELANKLKNRNK